MRVRVFENDVERVSLREEVGDLKEAIASEDLDEETLEAARVELKERKRELGRLEARLRSHTVTEKRLAIFEAATAALATVPLETLRERKRVDEHTEALPQLMVRFGEAIDCTLLLPKRSRKRVMVTAEQAVLLQAGAPWAAVQIYEPATAFVQAAVRVARGGRVQLRIKPSAFVKACTLPAEREVQREAKRAKLLAEEEERVARAASKRTAAMAGHKAAMASVADSSGNLREARCRARRVLRAEYMGFERDVPEAAAPAVEVVAMSVDATAETEAPAETECARAEVAEGLTAGDVAAMLDIDDCAAAMAAAAAAAVAAECMSSRLEERALQMTSAGLTGLSSSEVLLRQYELLQADTSCQNAKKELSLRTGIRERTLMGRLAAARAAREATAAVHEADSSEPLAIAATARSSMRGISEVRARREAEMAVQAAPMDADEMISMVIGAAGGSMDGEAHLPCAHACMRERAMLACMSVILWDGVCGLLLLFALENLMVCSVVLFSYRIAGSTISGM